MWQFLTKIDQFGSEQKLQIHPQNPIQQSVFGGVMTLILYGLSLAFFLSELIDWAQNNKLPKITSYKKAIDQGESVFYQGRVLEISYYQWSELDLDPFDPKNLTFYPIVRKIVGSKQNYTIIPTQFEQTKLANGKIKNTFYLQDLQIIGSPPNDLDFKNFTDYRIAISMCNQTQVPDGFQCADDLRNEKYFQQVTYFSVVYYSNGFDSKQKKLIQISKYDSMRTNQNGAEFYEFKLQMSDTEIDDGILFSNSNKFSYIIDFSVTSFKVDLNQSITTYGSFTPLIIYITLDQIKEKIVIEYPKISEILAETGSIISWILQLSFFVLKYNEKICTDKTIKDVIKLYYPDFDDLNIQSNIIGKCINVTMKEKKYDPQKITKVVEKLRSMARKKINYINLQHEVSKLQLAVTQTLGVSCLKQDHQGGKIEKLIDNLGCRIHEGTADNNSIKIIPEQYLQNKLISQENLDANNNKDFQIFSYDLIDYSIDLLNIKNSVIIQKEKQETQLQMDQQILPQFQKREDDIN